MSTIVYQGILQSCFESQIIETTTLKLKVPSSIEFGRGPCMIENNLDNAKEKYNYQVTKKPSTTANLELGGGWSCLENLSNISKDSIMDKESGIYVHPLSKRSRFSEKSLQLCTESLGSETGTDIIDTNIFSFSSSYSRIEKSTSPTSSTSTNDDHMMTTTHQLSESSSSSSSTTWSRNCKLNKSSSTSSNKKSCSKFPPPLTTIRGLNSVQFRPHREDGRLIIKAVEAPLTHNYLQAERSNGRLRLCFFKDDISASNFDENEDDMIENDIGYDDEEEEVENEDDTEEEEEKKDENDMYNMKRDIDGNKYDVEGEVGKEKCQRLSRCKESGKGNRVFCDWRKPLWVATS